MKFFQAKYLQAVPDMTKMRVGNAEQPAVSVIRSVTASSTKDFSDVSENLYRSIMSVLKACGGKLLASALPQLLKKRRQECFKICT